MSSHIYKVGSTVVLERERPFTSLASVYVVEAQMPPVGTSLQYRIKSQAEGFCRVVVEQRLSAPGADPVPSPMSYRSPLPGEAD